MGLLTRAYWTLAVAGAFYMLGMLALTVPAIQRGATYAHVVNPSRWQNLSDVEYFGFLRGQVQPFTVQTPDEQTIYCWHLLPLHLFRTLESAIGRETPQVADYAVASQRPALRSLLENPNATLVLFFHGNAAHLASACRSPTYQNLLGLSTPERPVHVIAFDYRGFGLSTGSPTEEGVTLDAVTLLSHLTGHNMPVSVTDSTNAALQFMTTSNSTVSPSQIVLVGQSLGTFVSTAAYHAWTLQLERPAPRALVLFASFTSLPKLLDTYSIKGIIPPLLSPLVGFPLIQNWLLSKIQDKWETARRLAELVRAPDVPLDLTIMHAKNDWEVMWGNGRGNWEAVMEAVGDKEVYAEKIKNGEETWQKLKWDGGVNAGNKVVRWELMERGGHNRLTTSEQGKLAVWRAIDGFDR
jgi:pimeloyl-ACP methyl ester carboxylesterase